MDHCNLPKDEVNLSEIKVEYHPIKTEPEYYQASGIDNNIQVTGVKLESDFASQTEKEFQSSKSFSQLSNLVEHQTMPHYINLLQCRRCIKTFSCMSTLEEHLQIHTGEKPF